MSVKLVVSNPPPPVILWPVQFALEQVAWWMRFWQGRKTEAYVRAVP